MVEATETGTAVQELGNTDQIQAALSMEPTESNPADPSS